MGQAVLASPLQLCDTLQFSCVGLSELTDFASPCTGEAPKTARRSRGKWQRDSLWGLG